MSPIRIHPTTVGKWATDSHRVGVYLAKFAGIFQLNVQDLGAQQTGVTVEEFKAKLNDYARFSAGVNAGSVTNV